MLSERSTKKNTDSLATKIGSYVIVFGNEPEVVNLKMKCTLCSRELAALWFLIWIDGVVAPFIIILSIYATS
jgi:hypothetical protein